MPGMPRIDKKTTQIAYKIIGIPANLRVKKTNRDKQVDASHLNKRLIFEETSRVR